MNPITDDDAPRHRSGAVARMLRMPVATLRVWERRYHLIQPSLTASGQRLYSANDVRHLAMIKQLSDLGHAIGSLARLDREQLRAVAATHAGTLASRVPPARPGGVMGNRLREPGGVADPLLPVTAVPARRWDDAALADVAGLSSTIACECPRHVAELLMKLSHFEAYSAECAERSAQDPDDAVLHAYLQQVAGSARAMFEAALERVAVHEGLLLGA